MSTDGRKKMIFKRSSRKTRYKTNTTAWMTLEGGFAKRQCRVLDLSVTGARLDVENAGDIDGKLAIAFTHDVRKATRCRLVWRKGSEMGVEFLGAA